MDTYQDPEQNPQSNDLLSQQLDHLLSPQSERTVESILEELLQLTRTFSPSLNFAVDIAEYGESDGKKLLRFDSVYFDEETADKSSIQDRLTPIEYPDQIFIRSILSSGSYSLRVIPTHLWVSEDGNLHCYIQQGISPLQIKGRNLTAESLGNEGVIRLEFIAPVPGRVSRERPQPEYESIWSAIRSRNEEWGVDSPGYLKKLKRELRKARPIKQRASPMIGGHLVKVPNNLAHVIFAKEITHVARWLTNESECYKYFQTDQAIVTYRPDDELPTTWYDSAEQAYRTLEERFLSMKGDLVADLVDILFWHWLANDQPKYAVITLRQILKYRGIKPHVKVNEEHWKAMRDLRGIRLQGGRIESESIFHMSVAAPDTDGAGGTSKLQTTYRYHPGFFLSEALERNTFFLAYSTQSLWKLNYYTHAKAKRLARVLSAEWRRNPENYVKGGKPRYRTWASLLTAAGIETEYGKALSDPKIFIEGIEKEIEELYDADFIGPCGEEIYHPEDREKWADLPAKGRLGAWLALRTYITPAADIRDALEQQVGGRAARKAQMKALEGKTIKPRRPRKGQP